MRRAIFTLALLALFSCKSKEEQKPPETAKSEKAAKPRPLDVPQDHVYAASNAVRVVDVALGQVTAGIDLRRAVTSIEFSSDGRRAFIGTSDGLKEVSAEEHKLTAELTKSPVRQLLRSPDGTRLYVLEHDVVIAADKTPEPSPFRLKAIDLETGKAAGVEEIGERILAAIPSFSPDHHHVVVEESGLVRLGKPGTPLSKGEKVDLAQGVPSKALMVRPYVAVSSDGKTAFVPVEGSPSRVLQIDLLKGAVRPLSLGGEHIIRGVAPTADGKLLVVNASKLLFLVKLGSGETEKIDLTDNHTGAVLSPDGRRVYLAQTIHEGGGAVTIVGLEPLRIQGKIHLDDISPWSIAVQPKAGFASRY
jgi:DNA-binding beta-propeller fold protein YncE